MSIKASLKISINVLSHRSSIWIFVSFIILTNICKAEVLMRHFLFWKIKCTDFIKIWTTLSDRLYLIFSKFFIFIKNFYRVSLSFSCKNLSNIFSKFFRLLDSFNRLRRASPTFAFTYMFLSVTRVSSSGIKLSSKS